MNRHDFVLLFDVQDGNPNGDPDAGNLPRVDPETMHGIVSDVALKRKVRDYVSLARRDAAGAPLPGHDIYVKHRGILANEQKRAFEAVGAVAGPDPNEQARRWMCRTFFDVRTFGAVMTVGKAGKDGDRADEKLAAGDEATGDARGKRDKKKAPAAKALWNCGQVRGPVQITFARSIDPVIPLEHAITRVALTNAGDVGPVSEEGAETARSGQMGRKANLAYGLFRAHGFVSPAFAKDSGFSDADLELLWESLVNLFEHDRSAARGFMNTRKLVIFRHGSELGSAPAHLLFDRLRVERKDPARPARAFSDYRVELDRDKLPAGVEIIEKP